MFILIAGGGKLGYYLAKTLKHNGQELSLIEKDSIKVEIMNEELGSIALHGDACDPAVLAEAGIERADMVVAVTGDDEDNLVICQVAKNKFDVNFAIARVNNPRNEEIFRRLGIDAPVSSTTIIHATIENEIAYRGVMTTLSLKKGSLEIVETLISRESPVCGLALREFRVPPGCSVAMIIRNNEHIVPDGNTVLLEGDTVIALARHDRFSDLRDLLMGPLSPAV